MNPYIIFVFILIWTRIHGMLFGYRKFQTLFGQETYEIRRFHGTVHFYVFERRKGFFYRYYLTSSVKFRLGDGGRIMTHPLTHLYVVFDGRLFLAGNPVVNTHAANKETTVEKPIHHEQETEFFQGTPDVSVLSL